jgi:pimeloyl-ACP methyl ester carboxylesterase
MARFLLVLSVLTALLLAGCGDGDEQVTSTPAPAHAPSSAAPQPAAATPKGERVSFKAADGQPVTGAILRSAGRRSPALVLLHMRDGGADQWDFFQAPLRKAGFTTLAYDGRGGLDETELLKEVQGAVRFLRARGTKSIGVLGASIGATTALLASSTLGPGRLGAAVALSPADSPAIIELQSGGRYHPQSALMLSDSREKTSVDNLFSGARRSRRAVAEISGHGTALLSDPRVRTQVIDWLRARLL